MHDQKLEANTKTTELQATGDQQRRAPYEPPRVMRRKTVVRATLFTGSGGTGAGAILP